MLGRDSQCVQYQSRARGGIAITVSLGSTTSLRTAATTPWPLVLLTPGRRASSLSIVRPLVAWLEVLRPWVQGACRPAAGIAVLEATAPAASWVLVGATTAAASRRSAPGRYGDAGLDLLLALLCLRLILILLALGSRLLSRGLGGVGGQRRLLGRCEGVSRGRRRFRWYSGCERIWLRRGLLGSHSYCYRLLRDGAIGRPRFVFGRCGLGWCA